MYKGRSVLYTVPNEFLSDACQKDMIKDTEIITIYMIKTNNFENKAILSKGQKIIAALFLVTMHLPESDPLREKIRLLAVDLLDCPADERPEIVSSLISLLEAASLARMVSEHNTRIIVTELRYFGDPIYHLDGSISALFPVTQDKGHLLDKRTSYNDMSFIKKTIDGGVQDNRLLIKENKSKRQDKILSYINDRKSANIKDIATLFPDTSEKTIQRELGALVAAGKINKRGNKRWSLYLAI